MAAFTAHPGSVSCLQSLNLQHASSSTISEKVSSIPSSTPHIPSSLIPGVSISMAPFTSSIICRYVVVCRPFESSSRIPEVFMISSPTMAFTRVDFPTPEDPKTAIVFPCSKYSSNSSRPIPYKALIVWTRTLSDNSSISLTYLPGLLHKSTFVRITTGIPFPWSVIDTYLAIRLKL